MPLLRFVESVVLFVPDIDAAANWYADLFNASVHRENERYAYIHAPGVLVGFHPADSKCPGGVGGTTVYWEVDDIQLAVQHLVGLGARIHRGPAETSFGAGAAMLVCPFGCTIGLNQSSAGSRTRLGRNA